MTTAAPAAHPAEDAAGGWRLVAGLSLAQLVSWGALYYGFSPMLVPMEAELGWSRVALNGALALGLLVSGLAAYPVGVCIDRFGGRAVMTGGSVLSAAMLVAWAHVESLPAFYAIWAGIGLAMAATLYEPAFAVLTRIFARSYRRRITAMTLIGGFAGTVFVPATQFLALELGWRGAILVLAALVALIAVPVHGLMLRDGPGRLGAPPPPPRPGAVRRAARRPAFWALLLCFTAYHATVTALVFHLVPLLTERGFAPELVVAIFAVVGPSQVLARLLLLGVSGRVAMVDIGRAVLLVLPAVVAILALFPDSVAAAFAFAALFGAVNGTMTILRGTSVADLLGRESYGAVSGALTLPSALSRAAAPPVAALLWTVAGYGAMLWVAAALALLAAASFWAAVAASRRGARI